MAAFIVFAALIAGLLMWLLVPGRAAEIGKILFAAAVLAILIALALAPAAASHLH